MNRSRHLVRVLASLVAAGALLLTACSTEGGEDHAAEVLSRHSLDDLGAKELVEHLDTMPVSDRSDGFIASVRPDAIVVTDEDGTEESVAMPTGEFYLSIAPYAEQTHDCYFHSLTTCLGELSDEPIQIRVTDLGDGTVLLDESSRTYDNGFVGLWLPRDIEAEIVVEHDGRSGSQTVRTGAEDPTCLTTLRLS